MRVVIEDCWYANGMDGDGDLQVGIEENLISLRIVRREGGEIGEILLTPQEFRDITNNLALISAQRIKDRFGISLMGEIPDEVSGTEEE